MITKDQEAVRLIVRTREDFQKIRKAINNRLGLKKVKLVGKAGEERLVYEMQNIEKRDFKEDDRENLIYLSLQAMLDERKAEKVLTTVLKRFKVYNEFLNTPKAPGCGDIVSGWMLAEYDIDIVSTVSKMWQFSGLNPGLIFGKKSVKKKEYKESMGEVVGTLPKAKDGSERLIVLTRELVRGDRPTPGFLLPYNANLKRVLMGILPDAMIKGQGLYVKNYYYPMKTRLANSDREVMHLKKMVPWKNVSDGHRDFAAKRYMVKMFVLDFQVAWRTAEGLPVRKPYAEEYLGKRHNI